MLLAMRAGHCLLWFFAFLSMASEGADWPMFRGGPALTGVASGSLPEKPVLVWKFKTGGPVKSSAAIVQNRVYIGSDDSRIYALELAKGKKIWEYKTGGPVASSPLVLDGRVFAGSEDAFLYALNASDGKPVWKYETGEKIMGAPNWEKSGQGVRVLIGSYDFKLHCVDAVTGKSNWVYETGNYINGSPAIESGQTVFGGCDALLHLVSLADGKEVKLKRAG